MPYLLVRHKVADFSKWKPVYDDHLPARQKAGLKKVYLLRNIDDPHEVVLLFEAEDVQRARDFAASADLRETMQQSGVVDRTLTFSIRKFEERAQLGVCPKPVNTKDLWEYFKPAGVSWRDVARGELANPFTFVGIELDS
jgi:hypothetical protein